MIAQDARLADHRPHLLLASVAGLVHAVLVSSIGILNSAPLFTLTALVLLGWPFALGMLAVWLNVSIETRRGMLLVAAIGTVLLAILVRGWPAIVYIAVAGVYWWAWRQTGEARDAR